MSATSADNRSALSRSVARATEARLQQRIYEAVAGVVGPDEAKRMIEEIEKTPYPGEGPEDMETERLRFLREEDDHAFDGVPPEYWPMDASQP